MIVGAGNWIVDRVKVIDVFPEQDALANILRESRSNGGSAYNVLKALSKIGYVGGLAGVGSVGDDEDGISVLEDCNGLGIDTAHLRRCTELATSYTDVMMVEDSRRRTFFHYRGANAEFEFDGLGFGRSHVHLGYLLLLDRLDSVDPEFGTLAARALSAVRAGGGTTSIDVVSEDSSRFPKIVRPALGHADVAFLNEFELARTVESPISSAADLVAAGKSLSADCAGWLVVHTPDAGFAFRGGQEVARQGAVQIPASQIRGTVGAGDGFAAGYLAGFTDGFEPSECLRFAACVAASSLLEPDASSGILPWAACLELGERYGYRD